MRLKFEDDENGLLVSVACLQQLVLSSYHTYLTLYNVLKDTSKISLSGSCVLNSRDVNCNAEYICVFRSDRRSTEGSYQDQLVAVCSG